MICLVCIDALDKSIRSLFIIGLILLVRKRLNIKSIKWANVILWSLLIFYLLCPLSFLIKIKEPGQYGIFQYILTPMAQISEYITAILNEVGYALSRINRLIVAVLLLIYLSTQIIKQDRALKKSISVRGNPGIEEIIQSFKLKRKIEVFINDDLEVPITYGTIHPKIILQSGILEDPELLRYVLLHELTHIKKFDVLISYLQSITLCIHWYNPFVYVASKYINEDIEIFCDKLVIQKIGDSPKNRQEYCRSMLKLLERKEAKKLTLLKLQPTKERMVIMKKWKRRLSGVCAFVLVMVLSSTVFVKAQDVSRNQIIVRGTPEKLYVNVGNRVQELTDEEYGRLTLGDISLEGLRSVDINRRERLGGLEHRSYRFNMSAWAESNHDGFTVRISDTSCKDGVNYALMINEDGKTIYNVGFKKPTTIALDANSDSQYEVIVHNLSINPFTYRAIIKSYKK